MPASTKNDTTPVETTPVEETAPEVEDGSAVVEGTDLGLIRSAGSKVIGSLIAALDTADGASLAGALLMLVIAWSIRDADGFPVWSKGDWPETASRLFDGMLTDAGLGEEDGKRFTNAVRSAWSRSTGPCNVRDMGVALFVAGNVKDPKIQTAEVSPQALARWNSALDILGADLVSLLPEEMQMGPYNVSTVNAPIKKAAAEQLHHYRLTVPVRFGGTPKDSSSTQAKLSESVETAMEEISKAVAETAGAEGGSSFASIIRGIVGTSTAFGLKLAEANVKNSESVQDRGEIIAQAERLADLSDVLVRIAQAEQTPEDLEVLASK